MDFWWQDLRFGTRSLLRHPAATVLGLATLALGIGANTAIFSVVSGVLLKPLPFPRSDQFVILLDDAPKLGLSEFSSSPPNFKDWHDQNRVFSGLDALSLRRMTLTETGEVPEAFAGAAVTGDFFRTVGVQPIAGRLLTPFDDRPNGERVVVLGSDLWHRRFGGDPRIVNRRITLDGVSHTVVGVVPRTFDFPRTIQLWVPLALDYAKEDRGARYLHVFGRLKPGVSLERAQAAMSAIAARLERQYPDQNASWGVVLSRLQDLMVRDVRPVLHILQFAVWVVLLIACTNVANLLLARMGSRQQEIAVRVALGAGRLQLARQIIAESVILFSTGGALGLLLASWGTRVLLALNPDAIPRTEEVGLNAQVLTYTLLVSVGLGMAFGLLPAFVAIGGPLHGALRQVGRAMANWRSRLLSRTLVLGEVALALILLVGAGLLLQSFARLNAVDPGFDPKGVIVARISLAQTRYPDDLRKVTFFQQALAGIGGLPGAQHAASIYPLPLAEANLVFPIALDNRPANKPGEELTAFGRFISPDYFQTMKIPRLKGRLFGIQDDLKSVPVAIVNRTMADRLWPGQDPIGQRVSVGTPSQSPATWMQVVGVVADVRSEELAREPEMEIYRPQFQAPLAVATLVVRTSADPQSLISPIRNSIRQLEPNLPLDKVQSLEQVVSTSLADSRFKATLLGILAALALVLAAVGVYGLVSNAVRLRMHEIGIRVAMGARRDELIWMLIRQGMMPVVIGLIIGLGGAYAACRLLASQLYKVGSADPLTYIGALVVLTAVALFANWLPVSRATRIHPRETLRYE